MIICRRLVCRRVMTSRAGSTVVVLPGSRRRRLRIHECLRSLKPCSTATRAADGAGLVPGDSDP